MQKTNVFLFTATLYEAKPILKLTNKISDDIVNKVKIRTFDYNNRQIHTIITGIGPKRVKKTLNAIADFINNGIIINIGAAGSLTNKFKIGDWFSVNKIFSDDKKMEIESCSAFRVASILTSATEITSEEIKQEKHEKYSADLVDMEAFHIADFAMRKNMPCRIIKMVSDHANENTNSIPELKETMRIHYNPHAANSFLKIIKQSIVIGSGTNWLL